MRATTIAGLATIGVLAAACGAGGPEEDASAGRSGADDAAADTGSAAPDGREPIRATSEGCEGVDFYWQDSDCTPATLIELDDVISGGPPPDGIPPIDDPQFETVDDAAEWLADDSPVMVVEVDDEVRAYPLAILTWHEIVNDEIASTPMVVTYCPLCNSALAFERRFTTDDADLTLDFGTSGRLYQSNLLMYDRQTHTIWTQFDGEAVIGEEFLGERLERVPAWLLGFGEFARSHPDAPVLSRETGHSRDYGRNPYAGYDGEDAQPFLFDGEVDGRFPAMTRVVGIERGDDSLAVILEDLAEQGVVETRVGDDDVVVLWTSGQSSALDATVIDQGRDVGQTGAFHARLPSGTEVDLEADDGRFVDTISGSTFDVRGRAVEGPLEGERLEPVIHDDTFWFVWTAFREGTRVLEP